MTVLFRVVDCPVLLVFSRGREQREAASSPVKSSNPIHEDSTVMTSSNTNYFPKASPTNTIAFRGRVSTYKFWRDVNIQSIKGSYREEQTLPPTKTGKV